MIASHRSKNSLFQPLRGAAARCLLAAVPLAIGFSGAVSSANAEYSFTTINSAGGDGDFTQLLGINNAGTIAGYFGDGSVVPNNGFTIARPYGAGDFTAENFPGAVQTQVVGINNTGATVGFYIDAPGNNHGFIFEGGTYTTVDNPLTGPSPSVNQLLGINDKWLAAGFYVNGSGVNEGELADLSTPSAPVFSPVTVPAAFDPVSTTATDVNNAGDVSGFFTNGATDAVEGFLWVGTKFVPLNFGADTSTMAFGLNNEDQVVGAYVDAAGNTHGFVFNWVTDAMTTIDDPNADGTTSFGVEGTLVNGINDKGELVGFYANTVGTPDAVNGFLAIRVPEPSTWAMMLLGFAGLGFLGYRKVRMGTLAA
jgi:hypothetical protein